MLDCTFRRIKPEGMAMISGPIIDGHTLAEFRSWIQNSDAIVMTAVYSGRAPKPTTRFETPASAVARIAPAARRFQLMQLGVCLLNESEGTWIARPFTIDVFPAVITYRRDLLSKTLFDCDADHMKALSDANFDFNRVFHSGLNWFSPVDEEYILEKMKKKRAAEEASINDQRSSMKITEQKDRVFIEIAEVILNKFCETGGDVQATIAAGRPLLDKIPVSENLIAMSISSEGTLILTVGNGFLRRLLSQMISSSLLAILCIRQADLCTERTELMSQRVPSSDIRRPAVAVLMSATRDSDRTLVPSEVLRRKMMQELDAAETAAVVSMHEQIGFRYILEAIVKAGKPIFADDLLELLLHFECILMGDIGTTYVDVKSSFVNHWTASSLYDMTLDSGITTNLLKIANGFEKYSHEPDTLEAGALALRRASEISFERLHEPCCRIAIPGTISEICLEDEFDTFSLDIRRLVVLKSESATAIVDQYVRQNRIEVKHSDSDQTIIEAKSDAFSLISEINSMLKEQVAIHYRDFVFESERQTDSLKRQQSQPGNK